MSIIEDLKGIWDTATGSPGLFFGIMALFLPLILFKWWLIGRAARNNQKSPYAGWAQDGRATQVSHATGVGHQDVLILKPAIGLGTILFCLIFFGGGALFYALVVLPAGNLSPKDWFVFASMLAFTLVGVFLLIIRFNSITVSTDQITRAGPLVKNKTYFLSSLQNVSPLSKTLAGGAKLDFGPQGVLKVRASYKGYRQLLERLAVSNPKLRLQVNLYTQALKERI